MLAQRRQKLMQMNQGGYQETTGHMTKFQQQEHQVHMNYYNQYPQGIPGQQIPPYNPNYIPGAAEQQPIIIQAGDPVPTPTPAQPEKKSKSSVSSSDLDKPYNPEYPVPEPFKKPHFNEELNQNYGVEYNVPATTPNPPQTHPMFANE